MRVITQPSPAGTRWKVAVCVVRDGLPTFGTRAWVTTHVASAVAAATDTSSTRRSSR